MKRILILIALGAVAGLMFSGNAFSQTIQYMPSTGTELFTLSTDNPDDAAFITTDVSTWVDPADLTQVYIGDAGVPLSQTQNFRRDVYALLGASPPLPYGIIKITEHSGHTDLPGGVIYFNISNFDDNLSGNEIFFQDFNYVTEMEIFFTAVDIGIPGATPAVSAVPVPSALWLFASGLIGTIGIARRKESKTVKF